MDRFFLPNPFPVLPDLPGLMLPFLAFLPIQFLEPMSKDLVLPGPQMPLAGADVVDDPPEDGAGEEEEEGLEVSLFLTFSVCLTIDYDKDWDELNMHALMPCGTNIRHQNK